MFRIHRVTTGTWKQNCYIIAKSDRHCLVIDPGEGLENILALLRQNNLIPQSVLLTHAHYDHMASCYGLETLYKINTYLHSADLNLLARAELYAQIFGAKRPVKIPTRICFIDSSSSFEWISSEFCLAVLYTPGHTAGSCCFQISDDMFVGDLVFASSIGRTDLPGGDKEQLLQSLDKLKSVDDNVRLWPGHGPSFSVREMLLSNPHYSGSA